MNNENGLNEKNNLGESVTEPIYKNEQPITQINLNPVEPNIQPQPTGVYQVPVHQVAASNPGSQQYQNTQPNFQSYGNINQPASVQPNTTPIPKKPEEYSWDYNSFENYNSVPKEKKSKGLIVFLGILLGCLVVGLIAISLISVNLNQNTAGVNQSPEGLVSDSTQVEGPDTATPKTPIKKPSYSTGALLTTPEVAEKVIPSVVGIIKFESSLYEPTGLGSGFIIKEQDGYYYIATNYHVVASGNGFKVRLYDSRDLDANLVGGDPQSDLAVLRVKATDLVIAEMGNSDEIRVGETVVAIGNPLDLALSSSVTQGIVSALNRNLQMNNILNYIQTDAAINPGNSGGVLVNMYGQVIGINTVKVQGTGLEGLGFALPINEAMPILEELMVNGKVNSRPVLGITGVEIDEAVAYELDLPVGLQVKGVSEKAKFTPNLELEDVITHVDGERITSLSTLKVILSKHKVGDTVELTVYRKDAMKGSVQEGVKITAELISAN